jgi:hypothetical protein
VLGLDVHLDRERAPVGDAQRRLEALGQALAQRRGGGGVARAGTLMRSMTTSMSCFSAFFSFGTSAASTVAPSTRKRT